MLDWEGKVGMVYCRDGGMEGGVDMMNCMEGGFDMMNCVCGGFDMMNWGEVGGRDIMIKPGQDEPIKSESPSLPKKTLDVAPTSVSNLCNGTKKKPICFESPWPRKDKG